MSKIIAFFRNIFTPGGHTREGDPYMDVSVRMSPEIFCRLDRLARSTETAGDSYIHMALIEWLEAHEQDLLNGRVRAVSKGA